MKPDREGESDSNTEWRWSKRGASDGERVRVNRYYDALRTTRSAVGAAEANQAWINRDWSCQNKIHPVFWAPAELPRQQQLFLRFPIISDGFSLMDIHPRPPPHCFRNPV